MDTLLIPPASWTHWIDFHKFSGQTLNSTNFVDKLWIPLNSWTHCSASRAVNVQFFRRIFYSCFHAKKNKNNKQSFFKDLWAELAVKNHGRKKNEAKKMWIKMPNLIGQKISMMLTLDLRVSVWIQECLSCHHKVMLNKNPPKKREENHTL